MLSSIENLELGHGDDIAYGTDGANVIRGLWGNDTIRGRNGNDTLHGDDGIDGLYGGGGNDTLDPDAYGGLGLDGDPVDGDNDVVDGGAGIDTVYYGGAARSVTVELAASWATGDDIGFDLLSGVENIIGGSGDDYLYGNDAANQIVGGYGHDVLYGRGGNDHLLGGEGHDILRPGSGNDTVDGGAGTDTLSYSDSALSWLVDLSGGYASAGLGSYQTLDQHRGCSPRDRRRLRLRKQRRQCDCRQRWQRLPRRRCRRQRQALWWRRQRQAPVAVRARIGWKAAAATISSRSTTESQLATIDDFTDGSDRIALNMTLYESFDDLAIEADADGNAVVYMGPRQITLVGVSVGEISNSDFIWL